MQKSNGSEGNKDNRNYKTIIHLVFSVLLPERLTTHKNRFAPSAPEIGILQRPIRLQSSYLRVLIRR